MNYIVFTDSHLRASAPKWRKDKWPEVILGKLVEILNIMEERNCPNCICLGDFYDKPDVSYGLVNRIMNEFVYSLPYGSKFHYILGQHDIYGYNEDTYSRSAISMLGLDTRTHLLDPTEPSDICGWSSNSNILDNIRTKFRDWEDNICTIVLCVHAMVVPKPVPWEHILIDDIGIEGPKFLLCGDYHPGFPITEHNGMKVINPGALARLSISDADRQPQVAYIDTDTGEAEYIPISCVPAEEVFDIDKAKEEKDNKVQVEAFLERVNQVGVSAVMEGLSPLEII